ncbi:MAG TPA: flagellar hook-basal body complex protein, partial [Chloroflexi bacterium]|nr:flagellar hook-basal body complex protein [Chloroflexota bacterium]
SRVIGQIALAEFGNPAGLIRAGGNLFLPSANSGLAQIGVAGDGARGSISAGFLEMSNVDLAREFTDMIVAQRGFQANSRVISTSDEVLQELVNLKR